MKNFTPLISIVIPVYNAAAKMLPTIKSLRSQTYSNLELIFVNDCSTDESLSIIKKISKVDHRIKVIENISNERALRSRWIGTKASSGDYVLYCDADDEMPLNAVEKLVQRAINSDSDIVLGSIATTIDRYLIFKVKSFNLVGRALVDQTFSDEEIEKEFGLAFFGTHSIPVTSPAKLISRKIIEKFLIVDPPKIHIFDDVYLNLILFSNARKISFIKDIVYFYKYGGVTSTFDDRLLNDLQTVFNFRKEYYTAKNKAAAEHSSFTEMKNTIEAYFLNSVLIANYKKTEFLKLAIAFQNYKLFKEMKQYFSIHKSSPFMEALFLDDLNNAYDILQEMHKKVKIKRKVKRAIAKLISSL